jgi:hypothetical protein
MAHKATKFALLHQENNLELLGTAETKFSAILE